MECSDVCYYLYNYIDGELDPAKMMLIKEHLSLCHACMREFEIRQNLKSLIQRNSTNITIPKNLKNRVMVELGRAEEYRESGIQALDLVCWGTHIAQLYKDTDELAEILVPYMEQGLNENELCLWIISEISEEEARYALKDEIPSIYKYIDSRQMQIFHYEDWYLSGGGFDVRRVLDNATKKYQEALNNGYSGLRATGNLFWLDQTNWESFMDYENILNTIIPTQKILAICAYKEDKCADLNDVVNTHKYVISKKQDSWKLV